MARCFFVAAACVATPTAVILLALLVLVLIEYDFDSTHLHRPRFGCQSGSAASEVPVNLSGWAIRPVHFMKCGGSFGNVVMHYACDGVPEDHFDGGRQPVPWQPTRFPALWIFRHYLLRFRSKTMRWGPRGLLAMYGDVVQSGRCPRLGGSRDFAGHVPLQPCDRGRAAAMFREPSHRVLSAFYDFSWRLLQKTAPGLPLRSLRELNVIQKPWEYLNYRDANRTKPVEACMTKMVLGHQCYSPMNVTKSMVQEAVALVESGFVFVGITEFWAASMDLFHRKFGGTPRPFQNLNNKRGHQRLDNRSQQADIIRQPWEHWHEMHGSYDLAKLGGARDVIDEALYEAALRVFLQDCRHYGVDLDAHGVPADADVRYAQARLHEAGRQGPAAPLASSGAGTSSRPEL